MSTRRPISFWRYSLQAELLAAGIAAVVLLAGSWFTLRQLQQRELELVQADGERVSLYLREHLAAGISQLEGLAELPLDQQQPAPQLLPQPFSDLYMIDANQRLQQILKAVPGSRVFEGFSFAGSQIQPYLNQRTAAGRAATSVITRGLEDERASIYVQRALAPSRPGPAATPERWLLGRLNLRYIEGFLTQFSRYSGTPVLLVTNDGFVMVSDQTMTVPAIDLSLAATTKPPINPLALIDTPWLPLITADTGLGARVVILVPMERLRRQQQAVVIAAAIAAALIALVFLAKVLHMRQRLYRPVRRFAGQLQKLEAHIRAPAASRKPLQPPAGTGGPFVASAFKEIQQIQASFAALIQGIHQRDQTLQQQLRTSLTAATIAHELNLPLGTIHLLCQQARHQIERAGVVSNVPELVANLDQQSQDVSHIIERMRMLLRNVRTELQPILLGDVVHSTCTYLSRLVREQQVELSCTGLERQSSLVQGDAGQLKTALTNLVRNAIEAVASQPIGRRLVTLHLTAQRAGQGRELVLQVADSGPGFGFDPSDETLFQTTKAAGSGLGLFVVRTTLHNHRGRLELGRSRSLGGAQVNLILPLLEPSSVPCL